MTKSAPKTQTILLAGGTGFVGKALVSFLSDQGYRLHVLTRRPIASVEENIRFFKWNIEEEYIDADAFEGVNAVINLTGANISEKRWTKKRRQEILESRVHSINLLYQYVRQYKVPLETFISTSAVGYYGTVTSDQIYTETDESGDDFLGDICSKWETAAQQFDDLGVRTVILRLGVVIGKKGGMYQRLAPLAKKGLSVSLGSGKQYLPWIDLRDLARLFEFMLIRDDVRGTFNAVSSEYITLNDFSQALLRSFGKKSFLANVPAFVIRLVLGDMSVMLLEGSRVSNGKLKRIGFIPRFDNIEDSLIPCGS